MRATTGARFITATKEATGTDKLWVSTRLKKTELNTYKLTLIMLNFKHASDIHTNEWLC
jgi:hypothetical protein